MLTIVTGPDNTGKTTLVTKICRDTDIIQAPRYPQLPPTDGGDYVLWSLKLFDKAHTQDLIVDRGIVDEFVYGPLLRGYMVFTDKMQENILVSLINRYDTQIILCQTPIDEQLRTMEERPQLENVKSRIVEINNWFRYLFTKGQFASANCIFYDYTVPDAYDNLLIGIGRKKDERK